MDHVKPDVVIFLGDLMNEGSVCSDEEYEIYKERFDSIFNSSTHHSRVRVHFKNLIEKLLIFFTYFLLSNRLFTYLVIMI